PACSITSPTTTSALSTSRTRPCRSSRGCTKGTGRASRRLWTMGSASPRRSTTGRCESTSASRSCRGFSSCLRHRGKRSSGSRAGPNLPEVSLLASLDPDQEGFLRPHRSLDQTVGRAARHLNGSAIHYADRQTDSMRRALDEMNRRRRLQQEYNERHDITPRSIVKSVDQVRFATRVADAKTAKAAGAAVRRPADARERDALIRLLEQQMQAAAEELDF